MRPTAGSRDDRQALIEAGLSAVTGAFPYQRTETRAGSGTITCRGRSPPRRGPGVLKTPVAGQVVLPVAAGTPTTGGPVAVAVIMGRAYMAPWPQGRGPSR